MIVITVFDMQGETCKNGYVEFDSTARNSVRIETVRERSNDTGVE